MFLTRREGILLRISERFDSYRAWASDRRRLGMGIGLGLYILVFWTRGWGWRYEDGLEGVYIGGNLCMSPQVIIICYLIHWSTAPSQ